MNKLERDASSTRSDNESTIENSCFVHTARLKSSDILLISRVRPQEYYRLQEMALVKPDKVVALLYVCCRRARMSPSLNSDDLTS